jgi:hypothetical protein
MATRIKTSSLKGGRFRWRRSPRRTGFLRVCLLLMVLASGVTGLWALFAPRSFYSSFPGGAFAWVAALPPYNEHLVRDVGALYTGFCVLFLWATVSVDAKLIRASAAAWFVAAVPHLIFHLNHTGGLTALERVVQSIGLILSVVLPVVVVLLARETRRSGFGGRVP